jgi:nitronate monooxygenase
MAGACPPSSSIAVMHAGGFGACAALLMQPKEIEEWAAEVRANMDGPFQINLWIPDSPPVRDRSHEARVREFLSRWGPPVPENAGDMTPPNFDKQCQALLRIAPAAVSSIMGLYPPSFVAELKSRRISWFATATTVAEAKAAETAGADVIIAQGMEAGGHRGAFDATKAEQQLVGLFALVPARRSKCLSEIHLDEAWAGVDVDLTQRRVRLRKEDADGKQSARSITMKKRQ